VFVASWAFDFIAPKIADVVQEAGTQDARVSRHSEQTPPRFPHEERVDQKTVRARVT
jgi:hypothetical protein